MKNLFAYNLLLLSSMLFIGTLSPSDSVDGAIEKSTVELLLTAAIIFVIGAIIMVILKWIGFLDKNYSVDQ